MSGSIIVSQEEKIHQNIAGFEPTPLVPGWFDSKAKAHPEKILAESNKILIQWDLVFMKVDALERQKIQKLKSFM